MTNNFDKNKRLLEIRQKLGFNQRQFTDFLGIAQNNLSNLEKGRRSIGKNISKNVITTFFVNQEWFESGKGQMFTEDVEVIKKRLLSGWGMQTQMQLNEPAVQYQTQSRSGGGNTAALEKEISFLRDQLKEKDERILELKEHIKTLKEAKFPAQMPLLDAQGAKQ